MDSLENEEMRENVIKNARCFIDALSCATKFNLGGIPLHIILSSQWMAKTRCRLFSQLFSYVLPEATVVEGSTQTYRELTPDKFIKNETHGYHVWLEFTDQADGKVKVLDPTGFMVCDRELYYKIEEAVCIKTHSHSEFTASDTVHPNDIKISEPNDQHRLVVLCKIAQNFIDSDDGVLKCVKTWFKDFKEEIDYETLNKNFMEKFDVETKEQFNDSVLKLFFQENEFPGPKKNEQIMLLKFLCDQAVYLERAGRVDKNGNFVQKVSPNESGKKFE